MFCNTNTEFIPVATNNNNDGFGGGTAFWAIILFFGLLVFGGFWGRNGNNGNYGGNGGSDLATLAAVMAANNNGRSVSTDFIDSSIQRGFDNQSVINKLDGINSGLCNGFYTQNTTMLQGFAGVDNAICSLGYANQQGFSNIGMAIAQQGFQNQQCCCNIERNIDSVKYENAKNTCDIVNAIREDGALTRAQITQNEIQSLRDQLQTANFQLSQQAQSANLIDQLRPCPIPAYLSCSPYASYSPFGNVYNNGGCGCNSGCGCA